MEPLPIITDPSLLRQVSEKISPSEWDTVIEQLTVSIPDNALGLAAPQIGVFKRAFIARLSQGSFVFINPQFTYESEDCIPSEESCLSLPGVAVCVARHNRVAIVADRYVEVGTGAIQNGSLIAKGHDACILQHEMQHLDGVLITDLPPAKTRQEKNLERQQQKMVKKQAKKKQQPKQKKNGLKDLSLYDKYDKKLNKQIEMRVEEEERVKLESAGIKNENA